MNVKSHLGAVTPLSFACWFLSIPAALDIGNQESDWDGRFMAEPAVGRRRLILVDLC